MESKTRGQKRKLSWSIRASEVSKSVVNPIRRIIDNMKIAPNPDKPLIPLSIGDPTKFGNLPPDPAILVAIAEATLSGRYNGYTSSTGSDEAKKAIAQHISTEEVTVDPESVVLTNGCSGALEIAIITLAEAGQNVLIPQPGFPLYKTLAAFSKIETRSYRLQAERDWEADLDHMESLIDHETAAIIVNNPSNPCGSVYSKQHLLRIIGIAERHRIPIIADEIYCDIVYKGEFHLVGRLSQNVPVLHCGGLAKNFLVPGWRLGWIVEFDRHEAFKAEVHHALHVMTQRLIHPNTLVMGALPSILKNTPRSFFQRSSDVIQKNATEVCKRLAGVAGLRPIMPSGAMYMLIGINLEHFKDIRSDIEFSEKLMAEQSVMCLPASCFATPNFFRITLTNPLEKMVESCDRMIEFCEEHGLDSNSSSPTDVRR